MNGRVARSSLKIAIVTGDGRDEVDDSFLALELIYEKVTTLLTSGEVSRGLCRDGGGAFTNSKLQRLNYSNASPLWPL